MKRFYLTIALLIGTIAGFAQQQENIKQNAQLLCDAFTREDFTTLINYTYPRVLTMAGGKAAMIKTINNSFAQMKSQGVTIKGATVGDPGDITRIGKRQFCIVPQTVMMGVKGGSLSAQSCMLAITEDNGAHWYFLNSGSMKDAAVYQIFPEIKGKIDLPKQREPVFTADN